MITRTRFGTLPDGRPVDRLLIATDAGFSIAAITYGCIITAITAPDRDGRPGDVVLGHEQIDGYLRHKTYFGAVVGRHANRIRDGRCSVAGRDCRLAVNEGRHHLHGGAEGFDSRLWEAEEIRSAEGEGVAFVRTSPDGEEGYPGTLHVRVRYMVTELNELRVTYEAETDAPTVLNVTQHSYFNLSGGAAGDVLDHTLRLYADAFTPVDADLIPTGEVRPVDGTPLDFREPRRIGDRIEDPDEQMAHAGGYDHNWVIRGGGEGLVRAATLMDPVSGRVLEISTQEPGLQFYSGNKLDGTVRGKEGRTYGHRAGLCLETQHFPNGPNEPQFPSPLVRPGELFRSSTVFRFGVAP